MSFTSTNPTTGAVIATYAEDTPAQIEAKLQQAWTTWQSWSKKPIEERTVPQDAGTQRDSTSTSTERARETTGELAPGWYHPAGGAWVIATEAHYHQVLAAQRDVPDYALALLRRLSDNLVIGT